MTYCLADLEKNIVLDDEICVDDFIEQYLDSKDGRELIGTPQHRDERFRRDLKELQKRYPNGFIWDKYEFIKN